MSDITTILNACELVWRQQSVGSVAISDMRSELESHLVDAASAGKSPESVIGTNLDAFARSWISGQPASVIPLSFSAVQTEREAQADATRMRLYISIAAIIGVTLLGVLLGPKSNYSGLESWQWVFVLSTFSLLIGEMFTGGFFVLPFGIGAASASALSFAEVEPPVLIGVFTVVSALALWGLREFASKDDGVVFAVGGDRYVDQTGILTAPIQGVGTIGRVRIETESWMAITDGNQMIPEGAVVRVSEVRGTRMVVTAT
ncbi:NfeD family protein [bacterium]|jgi:membrane protein implicated in regulation of membrane protease activity|nr:NfeD family protein [bacterium]